MFAALAASGTAATNRSVQIQDDCDPATFNAAVRPGTCVGGGDTTFDEFIAQLMDDGAAGKWRFDRDEFHIELGGRIDVDNVGGEFHTFTEVANFGGGCIPFLNGILGLTPVPECQPEAAPGVPLAFVMTGVPPSGHRTVSGLAAGTHRFQCLIHPWMRSVATVRS